MQDSCHEENFITPYRYPAAIVLAMILILANFIYSLKLLPLSIKSIKQLNIATDMYDKKNYKESIKYLEAVLQKNPKSNKAKIAIAKSYFSIKDPKISENGLVYLKNVRIEEEDWAELIKVIPAKYLKYFDTKMRSLKE